MVEIASNPVVSCVAIRGVLVRLLDWIDRHIDLFSPIDKEKPWVFTDIGVKSIAELAFACKSVYGVCGDFDSYIIRFVDFIDEYSNIEAFYLFVADNQAIIPAFLNICSLWRIYGRESVFSVDFMRTLINTGYVEHQNRHPFRQMDLAYSLNQAGLAHNLPSMAALYADTLAAKPLRLPMLSTYDVYCFTHTIFYLTDMGQELPAYLPLSEIERLRRVCNLLTRMYLRTRDLDVLGELLICLYQLQDVPSRTATAAWKRMVQAQDTEGFIPGPFFSRGHQMRLSGEERRQYTFLQNYHTTLVGIIASFHALRAGIY